MIRHLPTLLILALLPLLAALSACPITGGGDDDDDDTASETIETVCGKVLECGGWGWLDEAECVEGFLDNPEFATDCVNPDLYLACMPDCMDLDCETFSTCEGDCWAGHCG
ncbi:MAG: hypothetical protein QGH45_21810 [Myxococcota bacterium]|jgi:hypothetical protein|nr:hypothetical protein [Myxococcota bacterium]